MVWCDGKDGFAMIGRVLLLAASLAVATVQVATATLPLKPYWERTWTVTRILCGRCSTRDRAAFQEYVGAQIMFAPDRFINPTYEDCLKGVDYSDIIVRSDSYAEETIPGLSGLGHDRLLGGMVGCDIGESVPNAVAWFIFDGDTAYYLFEGGAIFVLH